jgi:tetratricopeptide (TPR) repeat protein
MARKKRRPDGDRRPHRRPVKPAAPDPLPDLPDPRAVEGVMHDFVKPMQGGDADTPLERAQALMYQAFEESGEGQRARLAHEALDLCPDCADAYVLLAELARGHREARALYEKGIAAGERALGPRAFEEHVGHFWGLLETRPYMRARLGLVHELWVVGQRAEAVTHLQDMLRLNPNDNQGVRYTLAGFLLFLDRDDDLARLLDQYPDEASAAWAYTRALLAFRRQGDTIEARRLLKEARKTNKHVPVFLTGRKFPPSEQPGYYSHGDESEALNYIASFMAGWKGTPGAIAWLRANDGRKKPPSEVARARGPLAFVKKWVLEHLPQLDDVWQADLRLTPNWVRSASGPVRPALVLVTSRSHDLVLAHQVVEEAPTPALLWDTLLQAMQHPAAGEPHRPTELQVRADERWEALRPAIEEVGITLTVTEDLDQVALVLEALTESLGGQAEPGLLDVPGVTPDQVASFYDAAASFFQQAPWKHVGYESAIKIECDRFESGPWFGVLMGQSGLTSGLALYENLDTLRALWAGDAGDEENARKSVGTVVTFGEEWDIPVADLDAARRHGWKVARPDAYPEVMHKERGLSCRPPLTWELELMEACLRAVPDFVRRRQHDDPTGEDMTVPVASGELTLKLSWVVEEAG